MPFTRDPEDKTRRLLLPGKNNLAPEGDGLAFTIAGEPARIEWERDAVAMTADAALAAEAAARKPGPGADAVDAAVTWLHDALGDGPRPAKELTDDWVNGEGGAKRTLDRARRKLGVEAYRPENPGPWFWRSSFAVFEAAEADCQDSKSRELGNVLNVPTNTENLPLF